MEFVEIPISINIEIGEMFKIIYSYKKRNKYNKFMKDKRFNIYDNFERKILEKSPNIPSLQYDRRKDYEDRTEIYYIIINEIPDYIINKLKGMFVVSGWIPKSAGCVDCVYKKNDTDIMFFCDVKQKTLTNYVKNCKFFQQEKYK